MIILVTYIGTADAFDSEAELGDSSFEEVFMSCPLGDASSGGGIVFPFPLAELEVLLDKPC